MGVHLRERAAATSSTYLTDLRHSRGTIRFAAHAVPRSSTRARFPAALWRRRYRGGEQAVRSFDHCGHERSLQPSAVGCQPCRGRCCRVDAAAQNSECTHIAHTGGRKMNKGPGVSSRTLVFIGVASEGFEPPKATPADLQSDPFGRLGNLPCAPTTCNHLTGAAEQEYRLSGHPRIAIRHSSAADLATDRRHPPPVRLHTVGRIG